MKQESLDHWTRRLVAVATVAVAALALTCAGVASSGGGLEGSGPEPLDPERRAREREAEQLYRRAQSGFDAADFATADSLAGTVVSDYRDTEWFGPALLLTARVDFEQNEAQQAREAAGRYLRLYRAADPMRAPGLVLVARTLHQEGRPAEAADSLLATALARKEVRAEAAQLARQVVSDLGLGDVEAIIERWPASHPLRSVFEVERASLLWAASRPEEAQTVAREALQLDPLPPEQDRARSIAAGELADESWRPIVGVILPLSGPLAIFGRLAREGIQLAVDEYNERYAADVQLVVRDDADRLERAGEIVRELEALGAVAIIGPLRSEGLEVAARARRDRDLLIVSPTAPENYSFERNTFSVWGTTERVTRSARALAVFAVRDLKLTQIGVMHPATQEGRMQLAAFADAARAHGAEIVTTVSYSDTSTTFDEPMTQLRATNPQAVYAPASTPSSVIQLAPQFSYYGLRGVQVLGDEEWSAPEVARQVEPRFINGTVIATFLDRSSASVRWREFTELYERTYRKGLHDNLVPALAYDATRLVLAALPWGFPRRRAVSRAFSEIRGLPGATGVFTVEPSAVTRRPFLLQFKDRELRPAYSERAERMTSEREPRR